jgi:hypothetical protein
MLKPIKNAATNPDVKEWATERRPIPTTVISSIHWETRGPKNRSRKKPVRTRPTRAEAPITETAYADPTEDTPLSVRSAEM